MVNPVKLAGEITVAMHQAGAPNHLLVTVFKKGTGKIKAYFPSYRRHNPKKLAQMLQESIDRIRVTKRSSERLPEGRQLVSLYFQVQDSDEKKRRLPRRHPDCAYCGTGGDGIHVCGACRAVGIDGPIIRGTGGKLN